MILAGGDAARLRPLTVYTPNPLVQIANQPLLKYQIEILKRAGFREMTLVLGYHSSRIEDLIGDGREEHIRIRYEEQSSSQGTAGAFRSAMGAAIEPAVVIYGDILTNLHLDRMIAFHREKKALVTIATVTVENPSSFGMILAEPDGRISSFIEKPKATELAGNTINAGIYVIEPQILSMLKEIPVGEKYSFEEQLFPALINAGHPVYAYHWTGYWNHLGNVRSYLEANLDVLAGRLKGIPLQHQLNHQPRQQEGHQQGTTVTTADGTEVARIDQLSFIDPTSTIKPGAEIVNSVIGPNCFIEERAHIENSVLLAGVRIGKAAEIRHSVLGKSSIIGRNVRINDAVLGDKTSLADYSMA